MSQDLISAPLGSKVLSFSDEWFAAAENLITPTPPVHKPGVFVHSGAWYDGWETRRHNTEPADWVVFRLGTASGKVAGVEIDTAYFNGNHAPEIAIEGVSTKSKNLYIICEVLCTSASSADLLLFLCAMSLHPADFDKCKSPSLLSDHTDEDYLSE